MNKRLLFLGFILIFLSNTCFSQNINISIFNSVKSNSINFTAVSGNYDIVSNNRIPHTIKEGENITIVNHRGNRVRVFDNNMRQIGRYKHILLRGKKQSNYFKISLNDTLTNISRIYDNDLHIKLKNEQLLFVNDVNFEKYIAGVVEAEGGPNAPLEYFKTQAILCRTYAMKYYNKHLNEGFNLCDEVHCQAYKGRVSKNNDILKAAIETSGLVIVDQNLSIISATYFANSGGETANSEDVWVSAMPYLRGIPDKYSLNQTGYNWKKEIKTSDWVKYLNSKGIKVDEKKQNFNFTQNSRLVNYTINNNTLPLKTIRQDWALRSTFFSIEHKGSTLILHGKGYGHGVGMSQEGAMEMARQNFKYDEIIKFYFKDVNIMSTKALNFFQID